MKNYRAVLILILLTLIYSLLFVEAKINQEKCCGVCIEGKEKYYSIDDRFNKCWESCISPSWYWVFKIFEKNMEKAETNTPCSDRGYSIYEGTETHGFLFLKVDVDFYVEKGKNSLELLDD